MIITYTAQRSLIAGHVADNDYALVIGTTAIPRSRVANRVQQKTLSGKIETLYFGADNNWRVNFEPVRGNTLAALREMLDSTESGELFRMTLLGDALDPVYVKRTDSGYELSDFLPVGGVLLDWVQVSIDVTQQ
jgi:hypothetical protein